MGVFSTKLDQLEARLQTLVEGHLARLLPVRAYRHEFIQCLISAMEAGSLSQPDEVILAPDSYFLLVHPNLLNGINSSQNLLNELATIIQETGTNAGLVFLQPPEVNVVSNLDVDKNKIDVIARINQELLAGTTESTSQMDVTQDNLPLNVFLIVNGARIYPLDQSVVNIGRHSDNDLVIDDPRISRAHAQLRAVRGKYVLSDLGSLGGTFVNGQRITQRVLHPRDVISLSGLPLVYGQDLDQGPSLGQTQQMAPSPSGDSEDDIPKDNVS